ncbi:MAG: TetR/AcrR family transcriptional regulator [Gammaproteobacteria bacterium]|nr:MAG: TetR/AcrR family transcriptional regulator [Gammaproteobacteria bacterium]
MAEASLRDRIVDKALALAEESGSWESVRLHQVAQALAIPLDDIRAHFREKEDIVDAWFDRADTALLAEAARPEVTAAPMRERLARTLLVWLKTLAAHRRVTRQMVLNKLEPGHVHYQIAGLLRVSRTVQWWREAVGRTAALPRRAFEEVGHTSVYLATFAYWMYDESEGSSRTAAFLDRLLERAERMEQWCDGLRRRATPSAAVEKVEK